MKSMHKKISALILSAGMLFGNFVPAFAEGDPGAPAGETPAKTEPEQTKKEYEYSDDLISVKAVLEKADAVPDTAALRVVPVTPATEGYDYTAYLTALSQSTGKEYSSENTLLYDISFIVDDKEYEPEDGSVTVTMDFKKEQLKETLGAESEAEIEVKHLPTDDNGTVKVEDVTTPEVSLNEETVEFAATSFSVFAVTVTLETGRGNSAFISFTDTEGSAISTPQLPQNEHYYLLATLDHQNTADAEGTAGQNYYYLWELTSDLLTNGVHIDYNTSGYTHWDQFTKDGSNSWKGHITGDTVTFSIVCNKDGVNNQLGISQIAGQSKTFNDGEQIGSYILSSIEATNVETQKNVTIKLRESFYEIDVRAQTSSGEPEPSVDLSGYKLKVSSPDNNIWKLMDFSLAGGQQVFQIKSIQGQYQSYSYKSGDVIGAALVGSDYTDQKPEYGNGDVIKIGEKLYSISVDESLAGKTTIIIKEVEAPKIEVKFLDEDGITEKPNLLTTNHYFAVAKMNVNNKNYYYISKLDPTTGTNEFTIDKFVDMNNANPHYLSGGATYTASVLISDSDNIAEILNGLDYKNIIFKDNDVIENARISTDQGNVSSPDTTVKIQKIETLKLQTEVRNESGELAPAADTSGNYYLLADLAKGDYEHYYCLKPVDIKSSTNPSELIPVDTYQKADGSATVRYTGTETVTVKVVRSTKTDLTVNEAVSKQNCTWFSDGQITEGYKISEAKSGATHKFVFTKKASSEGTDYGVTINLYDYDKKTISNNNGLSGHYYIVGTLTELGTGSKGEVLGYSMCEIPLNNLNEGTANVTLNKSFKLIDADGNDLAETVNYDPALYDINIRMYRGKDDTTTLSNYKEVLQNGDDTVPGFDFMSNVKSDDKKSSVISLHKQYSKSYKLKLEFDPSSPAITTNDHIYLFVELTHQTTDNHYLLKEITASSGESSKEYEIKNNDWYDSNGKQVDYSFTGNETAKLHIVKATRAITASNAIRKENCYYVGEGEFIQGFKPSYLKKRQTIEDINTKHTDITDFVVLDKIDVSNDYDFKTVLGPGVNYGITADHFDQKNHMQSNLATNLYNSNGNIIEPDLTGDASGAIVIAKRENNCQLDIGQSHAGNILIYMDGTVSDIKNQRDFVYVVTGTESEIKNDIVEPIITYGDDMSAELLSHPASFNPTVTSGKLLLDTTVFDENATLYFDADEFTDKLSQGNLLIRKNPGQMFVFNFRETASLNLGEYYVQYPDMSTYNTQKITTTVDGYDGSWIKSDSPTSQGDKNNALSDICKHMVWNCASADTVQLGMTSGIYLIPKDTSQTDIANTSSGWIISDGYVKNTGGEWHSIYGELDKIDVANLQAYKSLDGKKPEKNQVFNSVDSYAVGALGFNSPRLAA